MAGEDDVEMTLTLMAVTLLPLLPNMLAVNRMTFADSGDDEIVPEGDVDGDSIRDIMVLGTIVQNA